MSTGIPFELEDLEPEDGFHDPTLPPRRAGLRRTRLPRRPEESPLLAPTTAPLWLRWITAPTFYYLAGTLVAVGLLLASFNPSFGESLQAWPQEAWGALGVPTSWSPTDLKLVALTLASLGGLIGLCLGARPIRPIWMAVTFSLPLLVHASRALPVMLAVAALAGVLLSRVPAERRRGWLLAALVLVGGLLFLPLAESGALPDEEAGAYRSAALEALQSARSVEAVSDLSPQAASVLSSVFLALALLTLGSLAWMGLGGPYIHWTTGVLVLGTFVLWGIGAWSGSLGDPGPQTEGVLRWARSFWLISYLLPFLPLCAAVCEGQD
jgi:hypothetical protein